MPPAFLATVLFSLSAVAANRATRFLGGMEANFWRLLLATALLALYAHAFGKGIAGGAFAIFFISGCIGFGAGDCAFFQALPRLGSRLSAMLVLCLSSPLAALIEWLWLRTPLTRPEVFWGTTILVGAGSALRPGAQRSLHSHGAVLAV